MRCEVYVLISLQVFSNGSMGTEGVGFMQFPSGVCYTKCAVHVISLPIYMVGIRDIYRLKCVITLLLKMDIQLSFLRPY
jgi:hypothetical protein